MTEEKHNPVLLGGAILGVLILNVLPVVLVILGIVFVVRSCSG